MAQGAAALRAHPAALRLVGADIMCSVLYGAQTTLQRELDEDVFGRAYGLAFPAAIAGIVVGSVIAPGLAALLGGSGALVAVGSAVLAYALLVLRGAGREGRPLPAPRPSVADAVAAR